MPYYHGSPTQGLTLLQPRKPAHFDKPACVYMTISLPMALLYGVQNFEYTYGYTRDGQIYYAEYFPGALDVLYRGRTASLYLCDPPGTQATRIPNELICNAPVPVVQEIVIPDVLDALLEQERLGALVIHRHHELNQAQLDWIRKAEMDTILRHELLHTDSPMAAYMRLHYPDSWTLAQATEKQDCK